MSLDYFLVRSSIILLLFSSMLNVSCDSNKKQEEASITPKQQRVIETASYKASGDSNKIIASQKKYTPKMKKTKANYDKSHLTELQHYVTQKEGTERPFDNAYWNHKEAGIYVDVVSGEPLFSSTHKYDSGTGWPSFYSTIDGVDLIEKTDHHLAMPRTELRSPLASSHLGHVFDDGPPAEGGKRFCINSASLRFIPLANLEKEGHGAYLYLFDESMKASDGSAKAVSEKSKATEKDTQVAVLAGGCFWGLEQLFRSLEGVHSTEVGYAGGQSPDPSYRLVASGTSGHAEALWISFDPKQLSYEDLLKFFFRIHDPTTLNQQGNDIGAQYRSAIFYMDEQQRKLAERVVTQANQSKVFPGPVVTRIEAYENFYKAEDYHQDYLVKNPNGYTCHRERSEWRF